MDFFSSKYKGIVINNLSKQKAGLALSYNQWPGATQIVIPLGEVVDGGLSTVDTSAISDKNVVSSMKEDDDKGIEARKDLVNIKEREAQIASDKATEAKKTEMASQKELEKEQSNLKTLRREAEKNPDDEQKQQEVKQSEQKIRELRDEIANSSQTAREQQAKADKKTTESVTERTDIAKDQQKIVNEQDSQINPAFALKLSNESKQLSTLVKINSLTGKTLTESPVTMIHSRTFYKVGSNFLAIAGENKGNAAVKLVLLEEQNKCYVGKFNERLELLCKSEITVNKVTPITVSSGIVYVTDSKGKLVMLSLSDLTSL